MSSALARRAALGVSCVALLVVLAVAARSCADGGVARSAADREAARRSAVRLTAFGCSRVGQVGMGAMVEGGLVATVAHVVAGSTEIVAVAADGRTSPATVVAIDRGKDLALLAVDLDLPVLALGTPTAGAPGSYVVWRADAPAVIDTELTRLVSLTAPTIDHDSTAGRMGVQIAAEVVSGDSGSVVVSGGRAVAMVFARSTQSVDRGWATDVAELSPLLSGLDPGATPAPVDVGTCS